MSRASLIRVQHLASTFLILIRNNVQTKLADNEPPGECRRAISKNPAAVSSVAATANGLNCAGMGSINVAPSATNTKNQRH